MAQTEVLEQLVFKVMLVRQEPLVLQEMTAALGQRD
jgi:hypothetical protein